MTAPRDYGAELDALTVQLNELKQLVSQLTANRSPSPKQVRIDAAKINDESGALFYSGQYRGKNGFKWEPQQRNVAQLLELDTDKIAKILAALGNKQRLDILTAVLRKPLTGAELVERLNMGTTGQLYHHTKALLGADLLIQEDRGGKYSFPPHRSLPFLLLLAVGSDLLETSDYMELTEARNNVSTYLNSAQADYDPHHLLWAVIENCILEHQAGYCTEVNLILQSDRCITVADNGRGIPAHTLPDGNKTSVQTILTQMGQRNSSATVMAPGGVQGINMAVVNALSEQLSVEVRREGKIYRQEFKHGIPQTELIVIGVTKETGTGITFTLDRDIFKTVFDVSTVNNHLEDLASTYPKLKFQILD